MRAVFFDFGDTLVTTDPGFEYEDGLIQLHRSLTRNNIVVPYEDFKRVHIEIRDRVYHRTSSFKEVTFCSRVSRALKRFGYNFSPSDERVVGAVDAFMETVIQARRMDDSVPKVLQKLKGEYMLGLVSNYGYWKSSI